MGQYAASLSSDQVYRRMIATKHLTDHVRRIAPTAPHQRVLAVRNGFKAAVSCLTVPRLRNSLK
jgi:hypothetical protein